MCSSLACGECSTVLSVEEAATHTCSTTTRLQFDCPACRQIFTTQEDLESHMVNMWCPRLKIFDSMPSVRDIQVGAACCRVDVFVYRYNMPKLVGLHVMLVKMTNIKLEKNN
jgi:hypothetical protein